MRRAFLASLLFAVAAGAAGQRASADWRTIDTPHFRIHFPSPFEPWARHLAGSIEGIYGGVTDFVGYASPRPIDVVVSDPAADSNGMAIPFLDRPEIVLWTSPPDAETGLGDYTDWTSLLATHELAHIVHLTRPRNRSSRILTRLSPVPFGPLALSSPRWVMEGYATLVEGALTGSGRPAGSFRAMVLRQFGIEGKLPEYSALSSSGGWLEGSMAYLVGSAFLEWLSEREGPQSLRDLWKRMASRDGAPGGFSASFRGVFGRPPADLYDRFRAEITARALAEEKRLRAEGLVEGEPWQRLRGGTSAPQVSPDGTRLLVRRDPSPASSFLAVWTIAESAEERRVAEERERRRRELGSDPSEAAEKAEVPFPRPPRWTLPRADGYAAADPRWMPDGRSVLFARRSPDSDGVLHWDLHRWEVESGSVRRATRGADVADADPSPDGRFAVGVRVRYGRSALARVDLATGAVTEIAAGDVDENDWPVWSHPRVSPDGSRFAVLRHLGARWRLVTLPLRGSGGPPTELALPGSPVAPPAWSADGTRLFATTDASGIWNVTEWDTTAGTALPRTRVTGGAFSPAPTPDGRAVFFLSMTAKGVDVRRLDLAAAPPSEPAASSEAAPAYPLLPRSNPPVVPAPAVAAVGASRPYQLRDAPTIRPFVNFSVAPSGNSVQPGLDGDDVLGRLHGLAAGSIGDAAGPRGGTLAAAYRGLPVDFTLQLFSAIEKPGRQSLVQRPEFDQERYGFYGAAVWRRELPAGFVRLEAGGGLTHVEAFTLENVFHRGLGSLAGQVAWRRTRARWGFGASADFAGTVGSTDGRGWSQIRGGGRLAGISPFGTLAGSAHFGDTGGKPTEFDVFAIGGAPNTILPPGLDRNRVEIPALPADLQTGERFAAYRAELLLAAVPVVLYGDWLRSGDLDFIRVAGGEVRLERLVPAEFGRILTLRFGIARVLSDTPRIRSTRAYAQFIYRP
ncbi:MAG TPA: hypothetical protein VGH97_01950 [Thermoanaerobaculia bacterium]